MGEKKKKELTRRDFIKKSAAGVAGVGLATSIILTRKANWRSPESFLSADYADFRGF